MNTTGVQNYLSNVFRPIFTWDTLASNFTPKLELSNIDTYSGNVVSVFNAAIGDSASNVYVGSNAGNSYTATRACRYVTALGYGAASNISNDSNSVYLGYYAGANQSNGCNVISIGASNQGGGINNIFLGTGTGVVGQSNIFIGHAINLSNVSNQIRIGYSNQIPIAADLSKNWVGLGGITTPSSLTYATIDISGSTKITGNVGINIAPGTRTLDVNGNFRARDASLNALDFSNGITYSTNGYASIRGTAALGPASLSNVATLKQGIILLSAQATSSVGTDFDSKIVYVPDESGGTAPVVLVGNQDGNIHISFSTSNIRISNSDAVNLPAYYSVTYYPLL